MVTEAPERSDLHKWYAVLISARALEDYSNLGHCTVGDTQTPVILRNVCYPFKPMRNRRVSSKAVSANILRIIYQAVRLKMAI